MRPQMRAILQIFQRFEQPTAQSDRQAAAFPRSSRLFPLISAAIVLLALICALHREVLFGGAIYHMDDAADNYYPARVAFKRALLEGTLPSWETHTMGGWPLLADPYYGYFYPLNFVFYLGPKKAETPSGIAAGVPSGLGLSAALHAFLAGLGMFVYLRGRRSQHDDADLDDDDDTPQFSFWAALFGAICFALSSFLVVRIRHIIYVQMMAWVPFLLAAIDRYIDRGTRLSLVACAVCTALLFLAGAHSLVHFVAMLLVVYTAARLGREAARRGRRWLFSTTAGLSVAVLCGIAIAAVALLPTLMAMRHSARALGTDYSFASTYAWPSLRFVKLLFRPDLFGIGEWRTARPWTGPWNHWELAGYYQGVAALGLAIPGALVGLRRIPAERLGLLLLCAAGIVIALGDAGPLHPLLFKHLPLYSALRCPARALCMLVIAVPILAAHALDAGSRFIASGPLGRRGAAIVLGCFCAWTAADQFVIDRGYVQPRPLDFAYGTERFYAVDWLEKELPKQPEPARFLPDGRGPFRLLSVGETVGLESASGYSSMLVWRYVHLLYIINHGTPYPHKKLRYDPAAAQISRFDSSLVDMLNIRYLISFEPPPGKWIERFAPTPGAPLHARHEPFWDPQLRVYENTQVMPRAYVAYQARLAADPSEEAVQVARRDFDPHREIVLGRDGAADFLAIENRNRPHGAARIVSHQRHHVVVEAEAAAAGVLVLGDTYFPGWSATVDGVAAPIRPVNLAQRGVPLAPGRHRIEFRYHDRALLYGGLLSLLGLIGVFGLLLRRRTIVKDALRKAPGGRS